MPLVSGYINDVPREGLTFILQTLNTETARPHLDEIKEIIEDTIEYACDQYTLSGELVWTVVLCLATAKLEELQGNLAAD